MPSSLPACPESLFHVCCNHNVLWIRGMLSMTQFPPLFALHASSFFLRSMPNALFLVTGFQNGFCIPHVHVKLPSLSHNHASAFQHHSFLDRYICSEIQARHISGKKSQFCLLPSRSHSRKRSGCFSGHP